MPPKGRVPPAKAKPATGTKTATAKPGAQKTAVTKKGPTGTTGKSVATKKPGGTSTIKGKQPAVQKPVVKKWTKEDDAARKIQTGVRRFLAKRRLDKKRKEKEDYDKLMEKLEKEAFAKLVKMEQEKAEKEREKEEEERKRKREAAKRKKRMLEAAFDGDNDAIKTILKEVKDVDDKNQISHDAIGIAIRNRHQLEMVDCEDANNNTPLSEAASGGNADTIQLLIDLGANPNSQGQFKRTPLYRAAFAGHMECCQLLLQYGSDPRIYADDGQTPAQIASLDHIQAFLSDWDIEQTERLLLKLEGDREKRREEEAKRREAEMTKLEAQVTEAVKDYKIKQKKVMKCTEELNKRIEEHDTAVASGFERPQLTLQAIHDAESDLGLASVDLEKARDKMAALKLQQREQQKGNAEAAGDDLPGLKVTIRELDDVLMRDVGNRIKDSGKWPLLIDSSGQAATFLRYRDTNYVNALSPHNMNEDKLRMAILGALRYGKPLVLDMMEVDMFETCGTVMDRIHKGLLQAIMDKSILKEDVYSKLLRDSDGPEYSKNHFNELRIGHFMFVIITNNPFPPETLMDQSYAIRIHIPS